MGPEWKWSLKLNSTFYIGEPEKELPGSLLILGVIDRPQDYEFFQPSSLSALAGTSPTVAPRPLHTLKELKLKSRPPSQKNVRVRRPQADSWPGSNEPKIEDIVGAAQAQARSTGELGPLHFVWPSRSSKILHQASAKDPLSPLHLVWLRLHKQISGTKEARGKLVAPLEAARPQTPSCQVSSPSAGPSPHKRPVKLEGPLYFRGEIWNPIINRS